MEHTSKPYITHRQHSIKAEFAHQYAGFDSPTIQLANHGQLFMSQHAPHIMCVMHMYTIYPSLESLVIWWSSSHRARHSEMSFVQRLVAWSPKWQIKNGCKTIVAIVLGVQGPIPVRNKPNLSAIYVVSCFRRTLIHRISVYQRTKI